MPAPRDPLLRQLWLLKGDRPLAKFVVEFNSWGKWDRGNPCQGPLGPERVLSYYTIQSYLLGRSKPSIRNWRLMWRRIRWLRYARAYRAKALHGAPRITVRDATVIGIGEDEKGAPKPVYKDPTRVHKRDKLGRITYQRNPTARRRSPS